MNETIKLYYHKTDGGAEYLFDTFIEWEHNGKSGKEGAITPQTKYIVRIDGDITKDAELTFKESKDEKAKNILESLQKKVDIDSCLLTDAEVLDIIKNNL